MSEQNGHEEDFWGGLAGDAPEERTGDFDLPVGKWFIGRTANRDRGGAAPVIRTNEGKKKETEGKKFRSFKLGIDVIGAEGDIEARGMAFFETLITPMKEEADRGSPVSGRLLGFLNAVLSPGVGAEHLPAKGDGKDVKKEKSAKRAGARWANTKRVLREAADKMPEITDKDKPHLSFPGEDKVPRAIAALGLTALLDESRLVLFKTKLDKPYKDDTGETRRNVVVGAVEDYTKANAEKRKVSVYPGIEGDTDPVDANVPDAPGF